MGAPHADHVRRLRRQRARQSVAAVGLVLVACSPGAQNSAVDLSRAIQAEKGEHVTDIAPSSVFPLLGKWLPLDVGGGRTAKNRAGDRLYLVELRGWLRDINTAGKDAPDDDSRAVVPGCNAADPDWHYELQVDPAWAATAGVDLTRLLRPANIVLFGHDRNDSLSAAVSTPLVHLEGIGFDPAKFGQQAVPAGWQTFNRCGSVAWSYDPLHPLPWQAALHEGQYVRVFGGLVTDVPHTGSAVFPTEVFRYTGIAFTLEGAVNGTMKRWAGGRADGDPTNAARWTEMHPPDIISVLAESKPETVTLRGVAVSSENCLFHPCARSTLDTDIAPPGPRPGGATLAFTEDVLPSTNFSTIVDGHVVPGSSERDGATITVFADHIHVHVAVEGQNLYGLHGRFAALYRVSWRP